MLRTIQTTIRFNNSFVLQIIHISIFMLHSLQWEAYHILLSESQMRRHNQVIFVRTQYLSQDLLKIGFKLELKED